MKQVYAFLAEGLEEVECLAAVDVMRRAGLEVLLVSISDTLEVTGSHHITIKADALMKDIDFDEADVLFLPGGMPGTLHLKNCQPLCQALLQFHKEEKRIAAICAAPSVLGELGILKGRQATCYPGFEEVLAGAFYTSQGVITDGHITTARGLGYALDLGLEITALLLGEEKAAEIKKAIQYDQA